MYSSSEISLFSIVGTSMKNYISAIILNINDKKNEHYGDKRILHFITSIEFEVHDLHHFDALLVDLYKYYLASGNSSYSGIF